jgi:hypothetical protein
LLEQVGEVQDLTKLTLGGADPMVVGSLAELFPLFAVASFPPETATLFVTDDAALLATLTVKVKTLVPLIAMAVVLVQVITCPTALQVQFAPFVPPGVMLPAVTLNPVGRVSVTVTVPEVATVPGLLETVKV